MGGISRAVVTGIRGKKGGIMKKLAMVVAVSAMACGAEEADDGVDPFFLNGERVLNERIWAGGKIQAGSCRQLFNPPKEVAVGDVAIDGTGEVDGVKIETKVNRNTIVVKVLLQDKLIETRKFDRNFFLDGRLDTFKIRGEKELEFHYWGSEECSRDFSNPPIMTEI
jgi:hypothetical protein